MVWIIFLYIILDSFGIVNLVLFELENKIILFL